jgi:hypothetical protein
MAASSSPGPDHPLLVALIDDAAMFPPGDATPEDAVLAHRGYRGSRFGPLIGPLVVSDQRLAEVGRCARDHPALEVSVVNTTGAGGLVSLAGRQVDGVEVVAVESALRDLDDLVGNAARVVSAAAELEESVNVFVEIPFAPGWERAVAEVEGAGLLGKIRTGGLVATDTPSQRQLAGQLSVLIEADLPFKATAGLHHGWPQPGSNGDVAAHGFLNLLLAIDALIDGAAVDDAAQLLGTTDRDGLSAAVAGWTDPQAARVRRRFRSFGCCGVLDPVSDLVSCGLLSPDVLTGPPR